MLFANLDNNNQTKRNKNSLKTDYSQIMNKTMHCNPSYQKKLDKQKAKKINLNKALAIGLDGIRNPQYSYRVNPIQILMQ